jgi:hypothetical protein
MIGNHSILIAAKICLLLFSCIQSQERSTIDLAGNGVLSIMVQIDSLVDTYPDPLRIPTLIKNNSPTVFELSYVEGSMPGSPYIHPEGVLNIHEGITIGIYDWQDSSQIYARIIHAQPAAPDWAWENDGALLPRYYELELAQNDSLAQVPPPTPKIIKIAPYETVEYTFHLSLTDSYGNFSEYYQVKNNHEYYLKLFYCQEEVSQPVTTDTVDCSISRAVRLIVRINPELKKLRQE